MDNVPEKFSESQRLIDSETQTENSETLTSLNSELIIDTKSQENSKISLVSDELRHRKSNRSERSESNITDKKLLEVVEEKPAFHEYTGLRLGSILCAGMNV